MADGANQAGGIVTPVARFSPPGGETHDTRGYHLEHSQAMGEGDEQGLPCGKNSSEILIHVLKGNPTQKSPH